MISQMSQQILAKLRGIPPAAVGVIAQLVEGQVALSSDAAKALIDTFLKDVLNNIRQLQKNVHRTLQPYIQ